MSRLILVMIGLAVLGAGCSREPEVSQKPNVTQESKADEGKAFLEKNKSEPGVVVLPSGLQYKILEEGHGRKPGPTDTVMCNYRGTFIDGKQFDTSSAGEPATFRVDQVIKGWSEALQLMPIGSKWQLFVPSDLAYGQEGMPPRIAPDSTLIFEVELVRVIEPAETH